MTSLYKLSVLLTLVALTACSSIKRDNIDYIVYGTYAGECYGHCSTMYRLEKARLLIDTTDSFFKNNSKGVTFGNNTLSQEEFSKAQVVKQRLPDMLLQANSKEFGSPDYHDQGGIFIEIKSGFTSKQFYIDTELDKIPGELRDYAKLIMNITGFKTL